MLKNIIDIREHIKVSYSKIHGKGVICTKTIPKNSIMYSHIVKIPRLKKLKDFVYKFPWDKDNYAICMSELSYINSSNTPNIRILSIDKDNFVKYFISMSEIKPNEELTMKYVI